MQLDKLPIRVMNESFVVSIPKEYYEKMDVLDIPDFSIQLSIQKDRNQVFHLSIVGNGNLILEDAVGLEAVEYPFVIDVQEKIEEENEMITRFLGNFQNTLDIIGVLWENIVLEVPISYTKHQVLNEKHEGWELVEEKEKEIDPRLAPLLELFDEEKE